MSLAMLLLLFTDVDKPARSDRDAMIQGARSVVAAVVAAGQANQRRRVPRLGDGLTEHYVRVAATTAGKLPREQAARAFLLGIGVALDTSATLRTNFLTRATWRQVETDTERATRLAMLGEPTMHKRHDLAQHFAVSAALTAIGTAKSAEAAGLLKEAMDAEPGGSGFSFADLAADLSGIALATRVIEEPSRLASVAEGFLVANFVYPPAGLTEGLSRKEFDRRFGGINDERFRKELAALRQKVLALPGLRDEKK